MLWIRTAFLFAALLGVIVQEGLEDRAFLDEHTLGFDPARQALLQVPVADYARREGIEPALAERVAPEFAAADKGGTRR